MNDFIELSSLLRSAVTFHLLSVQYHLYIWFLFDLIIVFLEEMRKNIIPSFIEKTWEILQGGLYNDIIRWKSTGGSFEIVDEQRFINEILPLYFKHSNLSSFVRQVHPSLSSLTCITSTREKPSKDQSNFIINCFEKISSIPPLYQDNF